MKQLKLAVIALFTLVAVGNVNAQDENNPWAVSFGANIVDFIPDQIRIYRSYGRFIRKQRLEYFTFNF